MPYSKYTKKDFIFGKKLAILLLHRYFSEVFLVFNKDLS